MATLTNIRIVGNPLGNCSYRTTTFMRVISATVRRISQLVTLNPPAQNHTQFLAKYLPSYLRSKITIT